MDEQLADQQYSKTTDPAKELLREAREFVAQVARTRDTFALQCLAKIDAYLK